MSLPVDFDSLSALDKRAAIEQATGMSWDQYSVLPGETKTAILLQLKGQTFQSGVGDMLGAAQWDATVNRIGGFVSGMSTGLKVAAVAGIIGIIWLMLPILKAAPAKMRKAVA